MLEFRFLHLAGKAFRAVFITTYGWYPARLPGGRVNVGRVHAGVDAHLGPVVDELVARVVTVLTTEAPVGVDLVGFAAVDHGVIIQQAGRQVVVQGRRFDIAHEDEDDAFALLHRVDLDTAFAYHLRIRRAEYGAQVAVLQVVGPGVVPAGQGFLCVEQGPRRKTDAAVRAAVFHGM